MRECCKTSRFKFGYCVRHYRFSNMQRTAYTSGKYRPKMAELEALTPADMKCPACGVEMTWHTGTISPNLISLQHDRSGTIRLICCSCNTRHARYEGDSFYQVPIGHKRCPDCSRILQFEAFVKSRNMFMGRGGSCRECHNARGRRRRMENPEAVREYGRRKQRERRQRMAEELHAKAHEEARKMEVDYYEHCGGNDLACNCPCVKDLVHGMTWEEYQALPGKRQCGGCCAAEAQENEVECICAEYDGRGRSVCGFECRAHPLNGKCPKCDSKTHENRKCIACSCRDGDE